MMVNPRNMHVFCPNHLPHRICEQGSDVRADLPHLVGENGQDGYSFRGTGPPAPGLSGAQRLLPRLPQTPLWYDRQLLRIGHPKEVDNTFCRPLYSAIINHQDRAEAACSVCLCRRETGLFEKIADNEVREPPKIRAAEMKQGCRRMLFICALCIWVVLGAYLAMLSA